jgi:hypothetical protein
MCASSWSLAKVLLVCQRFRDGNLRQCASVEGRYVLWAFQIVNEVLAVCQ